MMKLFPKSLALTISITTLHWPLLFSAAQAAPIPNANTTTSVVCYFKKGNDKPFWKWGLNADNSWFVLNGAWQKQEHTKIESFATKTNPNSIRDSCKQSKAYYGYGDYEVVGIYAANSRLSYNYPIYTEDGELRP
jgi:hypothetical protein